MILDDERTAASTGVRCRICGARNTSGGTWCSLCLSPILGRADLDRAGALPRDDPGDSPLGDDTKVLDPPELFDHQEREWLRRTVRSTGARVGVMVGGAILTTGVGFAVMSLVGSVL
jgi:hypothetical protein